MKFNFSAWSDSVQIFISALECRAEYICSDNCEKLVLMCSQVGNRLERYGGYIHCFKPAIYPQRLTESRTESSEVSAQRNKITITAVIINRGAQSRDLRLRASPVFHAIPGQQIESTPPHHTTLPIDN